METAKSLLDRPATELEDLVAMIRVLRAPGGCPWDQKQTLQSVRAYLIEEAHELAAAIDADDTEELKEELGDLLFQAAFIACLAEEQGQFKAEDAVGDIFAKMVVRHPHVFGDAGPLADEDEVLAAWEAQKADGGRRSVLAGVPPSLPALTGAYRLTQKAAGVGFDWSDVSDVIAKVREELVEVEEALTVESEEQRRAQLEEEVGDLLFATANLARHLKIDPEASLARVNLKFRRRFQAVESVFVERGEVLSEVGLEAMDRVWDQVKEAEKAAARNLENESETGDESVDTDDR